MAVWIVPLGARRLAVACVVVLGGCAATPHARALPRSEPVAVPAAPPAQPAGVASAPAPADPVEELLDRADRLALAERHADALAALSASDYADDVRVLWMRADLLRDLGRRHEAVAALRAIRDRLGADAVDPAALFELAMLERLEGDRAAARRTVAQVREVHGAASWTRANSARLARFDAEVAAGELPRSMSARDLLGNLRGAPDPAERLSALRQLVDGPAASDEARELARQQAVAIGVGDMAEVVRAFAVAAWQFDSAVADAFCAAALADPASVVRLAAIAHAKKLPREHASRRLVAQMAQESDAEVFAQLDAALRQLSGEPPADNAREAATAAGRAACAARWQARIGAGEVDA